MPVLGLDFGTTNTVAAWLDGDGQAHFVPMADNVYTLPSVVCFHQQGKPPLVGESARQMMQDRGATTIDGPKRFLGRRYASDFVGRYQGRFLYPLVEGPGGVAATRVFDEIVGFEQISALIVERVLELAEAAYGEPFTEAVVSFPAHFHHRQRRALRKLVEGCGLHVRRMVAEPTAAAVAAYDDDIGRDALIFDLGGGTFDATVIHSENGVVEVRGTGGDVFLGGHDFDRALTEALVDQFEADKDIDLRQDPVVMQRVMLASEAAKVLMSDHDSARVRVPCAQITEEGFLDLEYYVERGDLEFATDALIERAIGIANNVLQAAGMYPSELDDVVLIGGQTRMPRLRQRLEAVFGMPPTVGKDPSLGVALGAARIGAGYGTLRDVVSVPIYAMTPGKGPEVLFAKNTPVPEDAILELPTGPTSDVPILIYEAVDATAIDRDVLGKVIVPAAWIKEHGSAKIKVRLSSSFALSFVAEARGATLPLVLDDPSAKIAPAVIELAPVKLDREGEVPAAFVCEVHHQGQVTAARTVKLGPSTLQVECEDPPSPGSKVKLRLQTEPRPVDQDVVVAESLGGFGAQQAGRKPGFVARVSAGPESPYATLLKMLTVTGGAGEDTAATIASPVGDRVPRDVRRFVNRVRDNDLYGGLRMTPLDDGKVLEDRVYKLTRAIASRMKLGSPELVKQLKGAARLLERVSNALRDPLRRLVFDFRNGYELVELRLRRVGTDPIFDPQLLRAAWRRVHPAKVAEAERFRAHAAASEAKGDRAGAVAWNQKALENDPFDLELREQLTRK